MATAASTVNSAATSDSMCGSSAGIGKQLGKQQIGGFIGLICPAQAELRVNEEQGRNGGSLRGQRRTARCVVCRNRDRRGRRHGAA